MARTVLFIDYAPRSIGKIRAVLRTLGLQVHLARDGITGLEMFHEHDPDLVLVQDLIPRKHGFEVCREIKNSDKGQKIPVILLATLTNGRRHEVFDTGCDSCLETEGITASMSLRHFQEVKQGVQWHPRFRVFQSTFAQPCVNPDPSAIDSTIVQCTHECQGIAHAQNGNLIELIGFLGWHAVDEEVSVRPFCANISKAIKYDVPMELTMSVC